MSASQHRDDLIGESEAFLSMMASLDEISLHGENVALVGENGSGKKAAARAIHERSARRNLPFVTINCTTLHDRLIESQLFEDATSSTPGLIAQAQGGTLLLNEIEALSPKAQACLLHFLREGRYQTPGCAVSVTADVRILSTTSANLAQQLQNSGFHPELHQRLASKVLVIPPLRERQDDALLLANHFIAEAAQYFGLASKNLHPETEHWLTHQFWPGNVRELQYLIQREYLRCNQAILHIHPALPETERRRRSDRRSTSQRTLNFSEAKRLLLQSFEHEHLTRLMHAATGNVSRAARLAGKERRALGKLLKKHGIEPGQFRNT